MIVQAPFKARDVVDSLYDFAKGVHKGIDYTLLPKNQLSSGVNTTVRGTLVGPRPSFRKITLEGVDYGDPAMLAELKAGRFQFGCYYHPDSGSDSLMVSISGHLYRFAISGTTATVTDVSIPGDLNDASLGRNWLWQAEKWIVVTDGTNTPPIFYDGSTNTSVRSDYGTQITHKAKNTAPFIVPEIGLEIFAGPVPFSDVTDLAVGDVITYQGVGYFKVNAIAGLNVTLLNVSAVPLGLNVAVPTTNLISWKTMGHQLPPGREGCYGMGRVWMALVDGKQFVASDLVGGSSGTVENSFRDAVLNITENTYLAGGGNFCVPGAYGEIKAMVFSETLDASLGQGALQVNTPRTVFSCNAPVDRTKWQDMQNPILTESAKGGGGLSQWSTINVNSDILYRAYDGIRSLMLTRREFNTWGNVPVSREIQPQLDRDSDSLLGYTSAVEFDNRFLLTTEGELVEGRGVIWKRLAVQNHDPVSSLAGKSPTVYDALYWQGLNIFQLITGEINGTQRCFAFTLNRITNEIELWEILKSSSPVITDEEDTRIVWSLESPMIFGQEPSARFRLRLGQGEIGVNDLRGKVSFQAYWRPEFWPAWIPWGAWEECSSNEDPTSLAPSFRPNMGLPEPDPGWCDETTNRPLREGYFFQFKLVVTGHCKITTLKFTASTVPEPPIAPPACEAICPEET